MTALLYNRLEAAVYTAVVGCHVLQLCDAQLKKHGGNLYVKTRNSLYRKHTTFRIGRENLMAHKNNNPPLLLHSFVRPPTRPSAVVLPSIQFPRSLVRSFVRSLVRSFTRSLFRSFVRSVCSFVRLFKHSLSSFRQVAYTALPLVWFEPAPSKPQTTLLYRYPQHDQLQQVSTIRLEAASHLVPDCQ